VLPPCGGQQKLFLLRVWEGRVGYIVQASSQRSVLCTQLFEFCLLVLRTTQHKLNITGSLELHHSTTATVQCSTYSERTEWSPMNNADFVAQSFPVSVCCCVTLQHNWSASTTVKCTCCNWRLSRLPRPACAQTEKLDNWRHIHGRIKRVKNLKKADPSGFFPQPQYRSSYPC